MNVRPPPWTGAGRGPRAGRSRTPAPRAPPRGSAARRATVGGVGGRTGARCVTRRPPRSGRRRATPTPRRSPTAARLRSRRLSPRRRPRAAWRPPSSTGDRTGTTPCTGRRRRLFDGAGDPPLERQHGRDRSGKRTPDRVGVGVGPQDRTSLRPEDGEPECQEESREHRERERQREDEEGSDSDTAHEDGDAGADEAFGAAVPSGDAGRFGRRVDQGSGGHDRTAVRRERTRRGCPQA